ncbi:MAG: ABC transporter ATP-binding protein [Deltaproteobacteria bacterium]|nr:ABC transporter ATP-binding protein [Deltaproteobacteria bacterium]
MLIVEDIHTCYGDSYVLQGISLTVDQGSVVAILGRNGMGKTTLIRSVIGFAPVKRGKVLFKEADVTNMPDFRRTKMGMGLVPQGRLIFPSLTVRENLLLGARNRGGWNLESVYELFPILQTRGKHRGNKLSGGEQQMLAIARALMTNPDLLLMDEPTEGLAPLLVELVQGVILRLKEGGHTILLVEQNMPMALSVADNVHVFSRGRIVHSSAPSELWENEEIKKTYLGI